MYKKGLIIEVKNKYAIVLLDDGSMERIKIKGRMQVGQKIYVVADDLYEEDAFQAVPVVAPSRLSDYREPSRSQNTNKRKMSQWIRPLVVAALLVLVIGVGSVVANRNINNARGMVSIGYSEGVQVQIVDDGIIHSVYDGNGTRVDMAQYEDKPLADVFDELFRIGAVNQDENVVIATANMSENEMTQIYQYVTNTAETDNYRGDVIFLQGTADEFRQALNADKTFGRYIVEEEDIQLWHRKESANISDQEKAERLKGRGIFISYQEEDVMIEESEPTASNSVSSSAQQDDDEGDVSPSIVPASESVLEDDDIEDNDIDDDDLDDNEEDNDIDDDDLDDNEEDNGIDEDDDTDDDEESSPDDEEDD